MTYLLIILFICIIGNLFYKAYTNTSDIKINNIKVASQFTSKQEQTSFSILHLSDLHLENISCTPTQLSKKLNNQSVDMIALTGDFLDRKRSIPKLIPYLKVLSRLKPTYGVYAVFGNHDYVLKNKDLLELKNTLEDFDCHVLQNESDTFFVNGQLINIIGIDDYSTNRSNISMAYQHIKEGTNIVLTHDPTVVLDMQLYSFDYLMAGHLQ